MEYKRDRIGNVPFGLHDSRIQKIEFREDSIILKIDRIFQYANNDEEKWYPCEIEFTKADLDCCDILVFNHPYGYEGVCEFTGRELSFEEFINEYPTFRRKHRLAIRLQKVAFPLISQSNNQG